MKNIEEKLTLSGNYCKRNRMSNTSEVIFDSEFTDVTVSQSIESYENQPQVMSN